MLGLYNYDFWEDQLQSLSPKGLRLELQKTTQLSVIVSILPRRTFPEFGGRSRRFNSKTNQSINKSTSDIDTLIIMIVEIIEPYKIIIIIASAVERARVTLGWVEC